MSTFGTPPMRLTTDSSTRILSIDGALAGLVGIDVPALIGTPLSRIVDQSAMERLGQDLVEIVDGTQKVATAPRHLRGADGSPIEAVVSAQRRDLDGRFDGFDIAVLVGDDRTTIAATLPDHLRRLAAPAALIAGNSQVLDANLAWGQLFALPAAIAPAGELLALVHIDDREVVRSALEDLGRSGETSRHIEIRATSDHGDFWASLSIARFDAGGRHFTVTAEDVSRQHVENRILLTNEALFRSLAESSPIGIARLTTERRITYANPAWELLVGALHSQTSEPEDSEEPEDSDADVGVRETLEPLENLLAPGDADVAAEIAVRIATRSPDPVRVDLSGTGTIVSLRLSPVVDDEIGLVGHVATLEDVTSTRNDTAAAEAFDLASAGDLIGIADLDSGVVRYLNEPARRLFAGSNDMPDDLTINDLYTETAQRHYATAVAPALRSGETWSGELAMRRHDGAEVRVTQTIAAELGDDDDPQRVSVMGRVVTDGETTIEALVHRATHDHLTGLPNRGLLLDRLDLALARARREGTPVALLFIDLDRFKEVNDTHGHDAGDELLCAMAERMARALRPSDTVARIGGDEFVVLCEDLTGDLDAATIADRLLAAIEQPPIPVADTTVSISASIGIAVASGQGTAVDGASLLQRSDAAMYRAKQAGRARVEIFDEVMRDRRQRRVELIEQLETAIDEETLDVVYQPIVDLRTGRLAAVEALVRWLHPTQGLIGPDEFLPLAVQTRLDTALDAHVIRRALHDSARWAIDLDRDPPPVHVNVFARTLASDDFETIIADALADAERAPTDLVIEIPESLLARDGDAVADRIDQVASAGVRFAVDDVGSGATALRHLTGSGVWVIKLDGATLRGVTAATGGRTTLLAATIALGRSLGLRVIVSGAEDQTIVAEAGRLGADMVQGRIIAEPVDAGEIARLLPLRCALIPTR